MLCLGQSLPSKQVLSLRTGSPIAQIIDAVINPNNLKIEGWVVMDRFSKNQAVVLGQEIRDILPEGLVVNDHVALSSSHELIRLKPILDLQFVLIGKPVISDHKRRMGKVTDYSFDKDSLVIQKLYVEQPVLKSLSGGTLMVDRSQIIEITNRKVVVREATAEENAPLPAAAVV
jgi:sporulation protein YlmC with PRC-barrel domain